MKKKLMVYGIKGHPEDVEIEVDFPCYCYEDYSDGSMFDVHRSWARCNYDGTVLSISYVKDNMQETWSIDASKMILAHLGPKGATSNSDEFRSALKHVVSFMEMHNP